MPRISPVTAVLIFVPVMTLIVYGLIHLLGPGRPSTPLVLGIVAAPMFVIVGFGYLLYRLSLDDDAA